jgi:hypothetical protein
MPGMMTLSKPPANYLGEIQSVVRIKCYLISIGQGSKKDPGPLPGEIITTARRQVTSDLITLPTNS